MIDLPDPSTLYALRPRQTLSTRLGPKLEDGRPFHTEFTWTQPQEGVIDMSVDVRGIGRPARTSALAPGEVSSLLVPLFIEAWASALAKPTFVTRLVGRGQSVFQFSYRPPLEFITFLQGFLTHQPWSPLDLTFAPRLMWTESPSDRTGGVGIEAWPMGASGVWYANSNRNGHSVFPQPIQINISRFNAAIDDLLAWQGQPSVHPLPPGQPETAVVVPSGITHLVRYRKGQKIVGWRLMSADTYAAWRLRVQTQHEAEPARIYALTDAVLVTNEEAAVMRRYFGAGFGEVPFLEDEK